MTYSFLQHYWWFLVSLLGAILVFLLFVQGINSMLFSLGHNEAERRLMVNSSGRKWEITFTTLVTFGGAFFASFPLFYSTSFGGAYWVWMIILFTFVVQAVSYEFQNKLGNFLGARTFQMLLVANGVLAPFLLGVAVATFFNGANFVVEKMNLTIFAQPVISKWANPSGGLDALADWWNLVFGLAVLFLARVLGVLYLRNNVDDVVLQKRMRGRLTVEFVLFLAFFLPFLAHVLLKDGYAYTSASGDIFVQPGKYLDNFVAMWYLSLMLLLGIGCVLYGVVRSLLVARYTRGIWTVGFGVVLVVLALMLCAGWNNTAFYPSNADLQSSLTIENSCSSEFTLTAMAVVSLVIPFVFAYIFLAWRAVDRKKLTRGEIANGDAY